MVTLLKCCLTEWLPVTRLMALMNLPHKLLNAYLNRLLMVKLLEAEVRGRRRWIHTTAKGIAAMNSYRNAIALLNGWEPRRPYAIDVGETQLTS